MPLLMWVTILSLTVAGEYLLEFDFHITPNDRDPDT
jgi:hypothetical protein